MLRVSRNDGPFGIILRVDRPRSLYPRGYDRPPARSHRGDHQGRLLPDHAPVLTVDPGDTVVVGSLDASGYLARQTLPGQVQPTMFPQARGHCLTGPIEVRGAQPGDMLALRLLSLRPTTGAGPWLAHATRR